MRPLALLLLALAWAPAWAQAPPPPPLLLPGARGVEEGVEAAMETIDAEMSVAEAIEAAAPPEAAPDEAEASGERRGGDLEFYRRQRHRTQRYPEVSVRYGAPGDGFPARTVVSGTVVEAGSLRLCRPGRAPVSRWLKVRLDGTPEGYPPTYFVVAVQCHEDKKERVVGRRVRLDAWKSTADQPIFMAHDDVPAVDAPIYVSYPGNVALR